MAAVSAHLGGRRRVGPRDGEGNETDEACSSTCPASPIPPSGEESTTTVIDSNREAKGQPVKVVTTHRAGKASSVGRSEEEGGMGDANPHCVTASASASSASSGGCSACGTSSDSTSSTQVFIVKFSAGLCLTRRGMHGEPEALLIRRHDATHYELPKGHLESGETLEEAALREIKEETGLRSKLLVGGPLLHERYAIRNQTQAGGAGGRIEKSVHYFKASLEAPDEALEFGARETETRELRWVRMSELDTLTFKSNTIRDVVAMALAEDSGHHLCTAPSSKDESSGDRKIRMPEVAPRRGGGG